MASIKILNVCFLLCIFLLSVQSNDNDMNKYVANLWKIDNKLKTALKNNQKNILTPEYTFTKIQHTVISLESSNTSLQSIKLLNSINIHDDQITVHPILIQVNNEFFSIKGKKININSFNGFNEGKTEESSQIFISTVRSQFTYFAKITKSNHSLVQVSRLLFSNKKSLIEDQGSFIIDNQYGSVTDFCNAFSLGKKLQAFGTNKGIILFYKNNQLINKLTIVKQLQPQQTIDLKLQRLNNHLLAYSSHSITIIDNSNPTNQNIQYCQIPLLNANGILQIKYDSVNWKRFFVITNDLIYVYSYHQRCAPISIYPLAFYEDIQAKQKKQNILIAGDMLIISFSSLNLNYYYNLTDHSFNKLILPKTSCKAKNKIEMIPKSSLHHVLCDFCLDQSVSSKQDLSYSCYLFSSKFTQKVDPNDYSKMRVPLIIISLSIIAFVIISRNRKNSEQNTKQSIYQSLLSQAKVAQDEKNRKRFSNQGQKQKKQSGQIPMRTNR